MNCRISLYLLVVFLGFTSCITTYNMSSIQVEIMKPALFAMPIEIDTVAVFKRDLFRSDTTTFRYFDIGISVPTTDNSIHYHDLSNKCVDAFANYLNDEGYFIKVFNYSDSLNYLFSELDSLTYYPELHKKLGVDACIFLDYFHLDDHLTDNSGFFINTIIDNFPEFRNSTKLESIEANLFWTITFRNDSTNYLCKQPDVLYYGNAVYPELFGNDNKHKRLLNNTAEYLGKAFVEKIVPTWLKVERSYYRSRNVDMLKAEKLCMNGDWLAAAEIYSKETKNKNRNIAAKAKYNMALVCEMEGKPDPAIDWLVNSYSTYKTENEQHKFNCKQYIELLALRKKEIERLSKQIREKSGSF